MDQNQGLGFEADPLMQDIFPDEGQQDSQDNIDYQDVFEQARRQQVLRNINQAQSHSISQQPEHEQVMQILEQRASRQQRIKEKKEKQEMKKLRQQNALQFFRKVKLELLLNFRKSIQTMKQALTYQQNKLHRLVSCLEFQVVRQFQKIRSKEANNISRQQFINLVVKIFEDNIEIQQKDKYEVIASLAILLGIGFRKLSFIDISEMELESFYNLKYQPIKGKRKKLSEQIDILKNKLQRKAAQEQLKDEKFTNIEDYSYNPTKVASQSSNVISKQSQSHGSIASVSSRNEMIRQIKKTFHDSYCQIYCPIEQNWALFNMKVLTIQQIGEVKNLILDGKAIIGFYSIRVLNFQQKFQSFQKDRLLRNFQFRDHTIQFCDNYQNIIKRRHRLGCKSLYKNLMKESNFYKNKCIFSEFDRILIEKQNAKELDWATQNFPKSIKQMKISDYFVIPSLVQKYLIIKQGAKPIPNTEFHEEKVYYKSDLQRVSSKMGWVDQGRMVKQGQVPIKTTENKNKTTTKLYKFNQTQPFYIKINNGDFVLDEDYNSIYVPPVYQIPQGYVLIPDNVEYLCKRNKYRCARIVQGFSMAGGHLVPNNIGYLVQAEHREQIEKIYKERQEKLKLKKQQRKIQNAMTLWRKLFKSIIITQQVYRN